MNENIKYHVYGLFDPRQPENIRYIGYTKHDINDRLEQHIKETKETYTTHKLNWIRSLLKHDIQPNIILLEIVDDFKFVNEREIFLIKKYKDSGHKLTNGTLGGSGVVPTNETRQKMSDAHKGVPLSDKHKKSLSDSHKGKLNYLYGQHISNTQKDDISNSLKKYWKIKLEHDTVDDQLKRSDAVKKSWKKRRLDMKDPNYKQSENALRAKRWREKQK